jgi:hypothetical protein
MIDTKASTVLTDDEADEYNSDEYNRHSAGGNGLQIEKKRNIYRRNKTKRRRSNRDE